MKKQVKFNLNKQSGNARTGLLQVDEKQVTTPALVQTGDTITTLTPGELTKLGTTAIKQSVLPYCLAASEGQHPDFGDLHTRLQWPGLVVGDTGAEQAYRWAKPRGRKKNGVSFHEPASGQQKLYTPEIAMEWQAKLGCDLQSTFARWENYYSPVDDLQAAAKQTASWLDTANPGSLATITGGGLKRLRRFSVEAVQGHQFSGYNLAGIDEDVKLTEQVRVIRETTAMLPAAGVRYLSTCGSLEQALLAIINGIDLVDSDCAGQAARHGVAFNRTKRIHLVKEHFLADQGPLVSGCGCPTCRAGYSRSYLHQLTLAKSPLGVRLLLIHNLYAVNHLLAQLRQAIATGQVDDFADDLAIG